MADVSIEKIDAEIKDHTEAARKLQGSLQKLAEQQAQLNQGRDQAVVQLNRRLGAIASLKKLKGEIETIDEGIPADESTEDQKTS